MISNDVLIRNRFFGQVRSDWERAFTYATLILRKDLMPIEIIFPEQVDLIFTPARYNSKQDNKLSTDYMVRIKGKGFRRIYWEYVVIQIDYHAHNNSFTRTVYIGGGGIKCRGYKYIEVDGEIVVVLANFKNP
jgi:hypothetical protein